MALLAFHSRVQGLRNGPYSGNVGCTLCLDRNGLEGVQRGSSGFLRGIPGQSGKGFLKFAQLAFKEPFLDARGAGIPPINPGNLGKRAKVTARKIRWRKVPAEIVRHWS